MERVSFRRPTHNMGILISLVFILHSIVTVLSLWNTWNVHAGSQAGACCYRCQICLHLLTKQGSTASCVISFSEPHQTVSLGCYCSFGPCRMRCTYMGFILLGSQRRWRRTRMAGAERSVGICYLAQERVRSGIFGWYTLTHLCAP